MAAAQRRNDAHRHRLAHAERIADGEHHVANAYVLQAAQRDGRQIGQVDLEDRQVGFRVRADHLGVGLAAIGERHFDFVGAFHHMVVR